MIRHSEAPKSIDVHFVQNDLDPTGLGEPAYPPVFAALANALYKATGKRFYEQPFISQLNSSTRRMIAINEAIFSGTKKCQDLNKHFFVCQ